MDKRKLIGFAIMVAANVAAMLIYAEIKNKDSGSNQ